MLRALDNSAVPLYFLAVSAIINIVLDLLFTFPFIRILPCHQQGWNVRGFDCDFSGTASSSGIYIIRCDRRGWYLDSHSHRLVPCRCRGNIVYEKTSKLNLKCVDIFFVSSWFWQECRVIFCFCGHCWCLERHGELYDIIHYTILLYRCHGESFSAIFHCGKEQLRMGYKPLVYPGGILYVTFVFYRCSGYCPRNKTISNQCKDIFCRLWICIATGSSISYSTDCDP